MNIDNFGPKLRIVKNNKNQEKDIFINLVSILDQCWLRTNILHSQLKVDFYNYEEPYYNIIEDLIYLKYGEEIGGLILWYVYDRFDTDGELLGLEVTIPGKPPKLYRLKSAEELWNLIDKINKLKSTNNE
jgi:hypothetical protein